MKSGSERLRASLIAGILIHALFCAQAIYAAQDGQGGMAAHDFLLPAFLPHYFLMFFLPPAWPSAEAGDAYWWCVAGKLAVSLPASLLYGWLVGAVRHVLLGPRRCPRSTVGELPNATPPQPGPS